MPAVPSQYVFDRRKVNVESSAVSRRERARRRAGMALAVLTTCGVGQAPALTVWWDTNSGSPGTGVLGGTWSASSAVWTSFSAGTGTTMGWVAGDSAIFSAGTNGTGAFAVTVVGTQSVRDITWEEGTVTVDGGALSLQVPSAPSTWTVNTGLSATVGSTVTGGAALNKAGLGTLVLDEDNKNTGGVWVNAGVLEIRHLAGLGTGAVRLNGGTLFLRADQTSTFDNDVIVSTNSTIRTDKLTPSGNFGNVLWMGDLSIGTNSLTLDAGTNLHGLAFTGVTLTGNATFGAVGVGDMSLNTLSDGGTGRTVTVGSGLRLYVESAAASFGGTFVVNNGAMLNARAAGALGNGFVDVLAGGWLALGTPTTTLNGGVRLNGGRLTSQLGSRTLAAGTSSVTLAAGGGTLAGETGQVLTVAENIVGTGALTVGTTSTLLLGPGTGKVQLSAANTYTGGTTVAAGVLEVVNTGGSATGTGPVSVANGGTLQGTGTVGGTVTVASGGNISPGTSVGALTVNALTLSAGAGLGFELGATSDRLNVTGNNGLTLNGGSFTISPVTGFGAGQYLLIDYAGSFGGSVGNLSIASAPAGYSYSFFNNTADTSIRLQVTALSPVGNGEWAVDASGNWSTASNWGGGLVPDTASEVARFGDIITAPRTVSVDGTKTVKSLVFDSAVPYTIQSDGLILTPGAGQEAVRVDAGSHSIQSDVTLNGASVISVAAGAALTLGQELNLFGSVTKTGAGTLELAGDSGINMATMTMAGGVLVADGLEVRGGMFVHTGGTITHRVTLMPSDTQSVLVLGSGAGQASYLMRGSGVVEGNVPAGVSLELHKDLFSTGTTTHKLPVNWTNAGRVFMEDPAGEWTGGANFNWDLRAPNGSLGTFTNAGEVFLAPLNAVVTLKANLINAPSGVVTIGSGLRVEGDVTNSGTINTGSGYLGMYNGTTFTQAAGTLNASDERVYMWGGTFNYTGGSVVGTVVLDAAISFAPGGLQGDALGSEFPTLVLANPTGTGKFLFPFGGTVIGNVPAAVTLESGAEWDLQLNQTTTNAGTIVAGGQLLMGNGAGTLTNTGSLTSYMSIAGALVNSGSVTVAGDITVDRVTNSGTVRVAPSRYLFVGTDGPSVDDYVQTGGLTVIEAGGTIEVEDTLRLSGGVISLASGTNAAALYVHEIRYEGTTTPAVISATPVGAGQQFAGGVYPYSNTIVDVADGSAANDLTISASIYGPEIFKTGAGTLVLSGDNSQLFNGLYVQQGTLSVSADRNLGNVEAQTRIEGGTLLATKSFSTFRSMGGANATVSVASGMTLSLNGSWSGSGPLFKSGVGTLEMGGTGSGISVVVVQEGTLRTTSMTGLGATSLVSISPGATFDTAGRSQMLNGLAGGGSILLDLGNLLEVGGGNATTSFSGNISGEGSLRKAGLGVLTISGINTYTGGTTVQGGTLRLGSDTALPLTTTVSVGSGATLNLAGWSPTIVGLTGAGSVTNSVGGASTLTLRPGATDSFTMSGVIGGSVGINKIGIGTQTLSGNNTFTGGVSVGAGTLALTGNNTFTGGILISGGGGQFGTLSVLGDGGMGAAGNAVTLAGGRLRAAGSFTTARGITVASASGIEVTAGNTMVYGGSLAGAGALTKLGDGTLVFTGANTFAAPLDIFAGTVRLSGVNGSLASSSLSLGVGTMLELNNGSGQNSNRLAGDVVLRGGTFSFVGAAGVASTELLGQLIPQSGGSTVSLANGAGGTTAVTFSALGARGAGATVNFQGSNMGTTNRVLFGSSPATVAGDPVTGNLGAWATVNGTDWAKYAAGSGVIPFAAGDYSSDINGGGHVRLTASASDVGHVSMRTLNLVAEGSAINISPQNANRTLTLTQGGLLKSGTAAATISMGTIQSSTNTLNVYSSGGDLRLSGVVGEVIAGTDFVKAGPGTVYLGDGALDTRANTYTGVTRVQGGMLVLDKAQGTYAIPGPLEISGGTVLVNRPGQISPNASVSLTGGLFNLNGRTETFQKFTNDGGTLLFNGGTMNLSEINMVSGTTIVASELTAGSYKQLGGTFEIFATGLVTVTGTTSFLGELSPTLTIYAGATPGTLRLGGDLEFTGAGGTAAIVTTAPTAGQTAGTIDLMGASRTFTVNDGSADIDMRISARIASGSLTKAGEGLLRLEGANAYAGGTTLSAGTLEVTNPAGLGTGAVTFSSTATLLLRSDEAAVSVNNPITVSTSNRDVSVQLERNTVGTTGVFTASSLTLGRSLTLSGNSGGTLRFPGNVTLQNNVSLNNSVTLELNGAVSGGFAVTKTLPGTLVLGGTAANTYTGATTVNSGVLQLQKTAGVNAVPGNLTVNGPATVRLMASDQIANGSALVLNAAKGAAVLDLNNFSETIGSLTMTAGGTVNTGFGTLTVTGDVAYTGVLGTAVINGNLALAGAGPRTFTVADGVAATDMQISAVISGTQGMVKAGPGRLLLDGLNTFTGGITVNAGSLFVTNDSSLNNNAITLAGGTLVSSGTLSAPVGVTASSAVDTSDALTLSGLVSGGNTLTKTGGGVLTLTGSNSLSGALNVSGGVLAVPSAAALGAPSAITVTGATFRATSTLSTVRPLVAAGAGGATLDVLAGQTLSLGGGISGTGALTKTGAGTVALSGLVSTTGMTTVAQGAMNLDGPQTFGGGLTIGAGTLNVYASSSVTGPLVSSGSGVINHGLSTLTVSGSGNTSFAGALRISGLAGVSVAFARTGGVGTVAAGSTIQVDAGATLSLVGPAAVFGATGVMGVNNDAALAVSGGANLIAGLTGLGSTSVLGGSLSATVLKQTGMAIGGTGSAVVRPGASANLAASTSVFTSLSITGGGSLDLGNSALVLNYADGAVSPIGTIRGYLQAGYAGGAWTGAGGIKSASAAAEPNDLTGIAYVEASQLLGLSGSQTATWKGVTVDATSVLLFYTYAGDANLDGKVSGEDYVLLDRGAATGGSSWVAGDFDYSGTVTGADFLAIDRAMGRQAGVLSPTLLAQREAQFGPEYVQALVASVPEPSVGLVAGGLLLAGGGRRRRRRSE